MFSTFRELTNKKAQQQPQPQPVQETCHTLLYSELNEEQKTILHKKLAKLVGYELRQLNIGVYRIFLPYEILIDKETNTYCSTIGEKKEASTVRPHNIDTHIYNSIIVFSQANFKKNFVDISVYPQKLTYLILNKEEAKEYSNYRLIGNEEIRLYGIWLDFRSVNTPHSDFKLDDYLKAEEVAPKE